MTTPLQPPNERYRLQALRDLEILDTAAEPQFDGLVEAAAAIAGTPISLLGLVDRDRQWFKARVGLDDVQQTDRRDSFCTHTILQTGAMEVRDTLLDERFANNPFVLGDPKVRFYCGVPIRLSSGFQVGAICVLDQTPRSLTESQRNALSHLAITAASALEGRRATQELLDISLDLKASEAQLARANRALERHNHDLRMFVQLASHDMKSPLVTVGRLCAWAQEAIDEGDPDSAAEHLELLGRRVLRLERLLTDLREFANLGSTVAPVGTVDTWDLIERTFDSRAGETSVGLELCGERSVIAAQLRPLELVLRNLIDNAIKHRGTTEPTIRVTTAPAPSGESITFTVEDDGPGIDPEFHEAVFEPLRTLQSRDDTEGSGLGLAIVQRAVEQAGGSISLESDGVSGTSFRLVWPLSPSAG